MKIFDTYKFAYLKYLLRRRDMNVLIGFFRKRGVAIGRNCHIYSSILTPESYLIRIGDNVTIATGARFITHDNSVSKILPEFTDTFGKITIGNNCFIGAYSIVLPGVTLGDTCIVAAGSVVTKSFGAGCVVAGNPARQIATAAQYAEKIKPYCLSVEGMDQRTRKAYILQSDKLIER